MGGLRFSADARVGVGIANSSKLSPDHSKITTKIQNLSL